MGRRWTALSGEEWWGSNRPGTEAILRRMELVPGALNFPAGSIYWLKPLVIGMIRALKLDRAVFEAERGQVDGTLAHAFERALGTLVGAAGMELRETAELLPQTRKASLMKPRYVSAFYLPQFHPTPQNDAWWGAGYSEWRACTTAASMYPGHLQPMRPGALGYYDLRATEVMGAQGALAKAAGVDGFCVYHYWFDPARLLETPMEKLLTRPDIDFPFYLCWANEPWRRNWDGLSGEILMPQDYRDGFEARLVASTLPYMRDPRYQRPDGQRPRFVIYRPGEMPDPTASIKRMRAAWRKAGIGEVELGAVHFHVKDRSEVPRGAVDFWVEMPPHGLVKGEDYLFGGPGGNRMGTASPATDFGGLIYDYAAVATRAVSRGYRAGLPEQTIAGIMPAWDNTARRGPKGHIAYGANPARFRRWLRDLARLRLAGSYRGELMINAWNEWAEKAVLEPSETFGRMYLDVLAELCAPKPSFGVSESEPALCTVLPPPETAPGREASWHG
ncbi:glycoside hydrolase family 99-like domain-containing protein [Aquicoccus sp. G2-2]|uniref:glycoside hydrolase family 99-like domain-containing protein n=1 Tax=Aquicoccus sp. G2-2 TaxID=3092120 RepID=UPI002ADFE6C9|nr:glycoside hydrolase family 99-like domain-containing protein [Aquicoccus sp. G2-2]MEA1115081.1 glycoside hydrolase family 99-like domain-containing protein [Aquicoccus sp. G2-2]